MASAISGWPEGLHEALDWPTNRSDPDEGYGPQDQDGNPTLAPWLHELRKAAIVDTWTVIKFPLA
jgi:hypothetical protein